MLTNLTTDRSALVALYTATNGAKWCLDSPGCDNWLDFRRSICEWNGVLLRRREVAQVLVAPAVPGVRLERLAGPAAAVHALEARRVLGAHQRQPLRRRYRVRLLRSHRQVEKTKV
jgi:hypothetical protein